MSARTPLRAGRLETLLPGHRFTRDVRIMGVVPSTSDLLMEQGRAGATDGVVIVAEAQTRGRGRRGNRWECPSGKGLLFSVLLRPLPPPETRSLLSAAAGLALCRALDEHEVSGLVKWPNDVIVAGRKIAGVLVDLCDDFAVVGIGINVNQHRGEILEHASQPASSLALLVGRRLDRESILAAVLRELDTALGELTRSDTTRLISEYLSRDALAGARVAVRIGDRLVEGVVKEAHPLRGLLVRTPAGAEERLRPEHSQLLRADLRE